MKIEYRGFDIDVYRSMCMGGWQQMYLSVFRQSDHYELICDYTEALDPVRDAVKWMKNRIDQFIVDPKEEEVLEDEFDTKAEYKKAIERHRKENAKTEQQFILKKKGTKSGKSN